MCLICAEFTKGNMRPREVARALRETAEGDPHTVAVFDLIEKAGRDATQEFDEELNKMFQEYVQDC